MKVSALLLLPAFLFFTAVLSLFLSFFLSFWLGVSASSCCFCCFLFDLHIGALLARSHKDPKVGIEHSFFAQTCSSSRRRRKAFVGATSVPYIRSILKKAARLTHSLVGWLEVRRQASTSARLFPSCAAAASTCNACLVTSFFLSFLLFPRPSTVARFSRLRAVFSRPTAGELLS